MREKRKFIRFEIGLKVNYIVQREPKIEKSGLTKDVSATGMQLLTAEEIKKGEKIELMVTIPNGLNPVHLKGIVLWAKKSDFRNDLPYSIGIEFGRVEEDNKNTFLKFLCDLMYEKMGKKKLT